tara:strand:+ start:4283 stop:4567 length:285 start_codon:yes stop_codon:yes gene_type:complete
MGRRSGGLTKKLCWNCKISIQGNELHNKDYTTLKQIGEDLGISYNRVFELSTKGRKKYTTFKYEPKVTITNLKELSTTPKTPINSPKLEENIEI